MLTQDKEKQKAIKKLLEDYPSVPAEVSDIEASPEIAEQYIDMFGV